MNIIPDYSYTMIDQYEELKGVTRKGFTPASVNDHPINRKYYEELGEYDVVCGRNKVAHAHSGNNYFRELVNDHGKEYQKATLREDKKRITLDIIGTIQGKGGRFLIRDANCKKAEDAPLKEASYSYIYEKVSHALRSARVAKQSMPMVVVPNKPSSPRSPKSAVAKKKLQQQQQHQQHRSPVTVTPDVPKSRIMNSRRFQQQQQKLEMQYNKEDMYRFDNVSAFDYIDEEEEDIDPLPLFDFSDNMNYQPTIERHSQQPQKVTSEDSLPINRYDSDRRHRPELVESFNNNNRSIQQQTQQYGSSSFSSRRNSLMGLNHNNDSSSYDHLYMALDSSLDKQIEAEFRDNRVSPEPLLDDDLLKVLFNV